MTAALMRGADLVGHPIVDASTGDRLAEVKGVMFDSARGAISGFTLRKHGFLARRMKMVLPIGAVVAVGTDAVIVAGDDALSAPADPSGDAIADLPGDVVEERVFTESGRLLGTVRDVIIVGGGHPRVVAFEITGGPIGDGLVPIGAESAISGSALIVPDDYEQRIRPDLIGLAGELALIEPSR